MPVLACASLVASVVPARAHAFAERYDLPLPLWYYLVGAAVAVAVSFVAAGRLVPGTRSHDRSNNRFEWPLRRFWLWRALSQPMVLTAIRALSVTAFVIAIAAGFAGPQGEPLDNLLPVSVWIIWWVGLTCLSAIVGDLWRVINPVEIIARWVDRAAGGRLFRARCALPASAGIWWAVLFYLVFAWAEMAWPSNAVPVRLAWAVLLYAGVTWTGMAIVGIDVWLARADPFTRIFGLMSRFSPIDPDRQTLRPYGYGLIPSPPATTSEMAFVLVALASVGFDGLRETPWWNTVASNAMDALYRAGMLGAIGNVAATALVKTAGLLALPIVFIAIYLTTCWMTARLADVPSAPSASAGDVARLFVASLVPIALAYHLAHYLSYLIVQGQAVIPLMSDPFGRGWNLVGTRAYMPDLTLVGARFVWAWAVVTIVGGHIAAVFIAHVTALRAFGGTSRARVSQYPMLVLMLGYTMLSLWILSQPIVEQS